jgi:hypothetical protein
MYKLKMKYSVSNILIIVAIVVVLVAIILFSASSTALPYDSSIFAKYYNYEGFHPSAKRVHYSTYPENVAIDQRVNNDIVPSKRAFQPVWGLGGLFGPPNANDNNIEVYANVPGKLDESCANVSSGYSNSKGYLCFNPDQLKVLTTRGGNQTGSGCSIGGCSM